MKTIEQKAKAYDKALERAKEKYTTCYSPALLEYIFPELQELEDEKIRKELLEHCINRKDGKQVCVDASDYRRWADWLFRIGEENTSNIKYDEVIRNEIIKFLELPHSQFVGKRHQEEWIAWLEKQGDKDSQIKLPMFTFDDILALQCCMETVKKVQNDKDLYEKLNDLHGKVYDAYHLEKQSEQKPKFKVGDWISNDVCDVHIASIEDGMYYFDEGDGLSIVFVDERYHIWTIEDAMDGDVLTFKNNSGIIICKSPTYHNIRSYCRLVRGNLINKEESGWDYTLLVPATKEQRGALMKAMTDAGYSFDFEKKELKKIENEIEIPFGAKDSELQEATYYIPKGFHAEIDDDKVVIKKGEKPTAWSEDDERIKKRLINLVNEVYNNTNYITFLEHKELLAWLEKLDDNIEL